MKNYTITLDFVLQALIIFEGLSLWKLSDFASKANSASLFGKNPKEELKRRWNDMKKMDDFPWGRFLKALIICCVVWPLCQAANGLVWLFKWTPYVSGTVIPLTIASCSIGFIPCEISGDFTRQAAQVIFWFIVVKLGINLLTPLLNWIPFSQIQVEIQRDMVNDIKR